MIPLLQATSAVCHLSTLFPSIAMRDQVGEEREGKLVRDWNRPCKRSNREECLKDFLQGLLKLALCLPASSAFSPTSSYQVHARKLLRPLNISNISEFKVLNVSVAAALGSLKAFKNTRTNISAVILLIKGAWHIGRYWFSPSNSYWIWEHSFRLWTKR